MFFDRFSELCQAKGITPSRAAIEMGINKGTVSVWKNKGSLPQSAQLQKIADYFGVSTDYLLNGSDNDSSEKKETPALTKKDERDIEKILAETRRQLEDNEGLMFDGDPASPEAIESILTAMELGLQAAKIKNKEKDTPKKYRK